MCVKREKKACALHERGYGEFDGYGFVPEKGGKMDEDGFMKFATPFKFVEAVEHLSHEPTFPDRYGGEKSSPSAGRKLLREKRALSGDKGSE